MTRAGKAVGVVLGGMVGLAASAQTPVGPTGYSPVASPPMTAMQMPGPMTQPMNAGPTRVVLADVVAADYREAVLSVVKKPTVSTRSASDSVVCDPKLYEWMLDHPDRVSLAWQRLKVPCVAISDQGNGRFGWTDEDGSAISWQPVGRFPDGVIWYATGKVKPGAVAPVVPVKAVIILTYPKRQLANGDTAISPVVQGYLQTDSRAASAVMRMLGPTTPKLAEQAAEQLLFFFAGIGRYAYTHPEKTQDLLAPAK